MHILLSLLLTLASLVSTDHDIVSVLPVRPESGAQMRLAFGTVAQMTANTRGVLETVLTLREDGQTHRYLLSNVTRINGRKVTCFQTDGPLAE